MGLGRVQPVPLVQTPPPPFLCLVGIGGWGSQLKLPLQWEGQKGTLVVVVVAPGSMTSCPECSELPVPRGI